MLFSLRAAVAGCKRCIDELRGIYTAEPLQDANFASTTGLPHLPGQGANFASTTENEQAGQGANFASTTEPGARPG